MLPLDISILKPTICDDVNALEDFFYVTILTYQGKFKEQYKNLRVFGKFFFKHQIDYYDIKKDIKKIGYIEDDLHFVGGCHELNEFTILLSSCYPVVKSPNSRKLVMRYEIRVKEARRYEFWWDYVKTLRTQRKKTSGQINVSVTSIYSLEEICLYHPQISYQRNRMNDRFYEDDIWNADDIADKAIVKEHIEKYALDKEESTQLLYDPFVTGETFLRYW